MRIARRNRSPARAAAALCLALCGSAAAGEAQRPPPKAPLLPKLDEKKVRKRFWHSFNRAEKPALKADAVWMLRGVKEKASFRVLVGLLLYENTAVRRNACRVIAETVDPEGYFIKPLTGVLFDKDHTIRTAAVEALASARRKSPAVKVLVQVLAEVVQRGRSEISHAYEIHRALVKLTGYRFAEAENLHDLARKWADYWKANQEKLKAADRSAGAPEKTRVPIKKPPAPPPDFEPEPAPKLKLKRPQGNGTEF